ncbi:ABC transporter substrate-binding protein [Devosia rhodophyticola]|uniref:ABC transporter substrate-binding protein n=1 Tax=Devosia rhodophyticola TaxID=3026423 RepID=A0ABY7YZ05_9HYPH|nr:ABC transporter substrate-binding protein [Devosia rhodophyticola]WDR06015.1 ABC transporter substrate-binding protein [Devosia rhodophyticola]
MARLGRFLLVPFLGALLTSTAFAQGEMTDVGTPRSETLIVQTFDGKVANPDAQNPLISYAIWRGFRELGWSSLWEMDTAKGVSYPELAAEMPEVLNPEHTKFRVKLREGVYWSDGVEFTTDDLDYTLATAFKYRDKLTRVSAYTSLIKSWNVIDKYTIEFETAEPSYDFQTAMGVYSWGAQFVPVPKHIFEPQGDDVVSFKNTNAVTLGPYKIKAFDPNGFWQLWERRDDWERSGWGNLGEPKAKYVLYKDFGPEETRTLAFVQNQYDVDTFMSPDSIQAAKGRNPAVQTFSATMPFHDMNDACSWGVYINQEKAPFDKSEVRWALALGLDLKQVGITALSGQFKAAALPLSDTPITDPLFYKPSASFLNDLTLEDGYKPFNPNFGSELVDALKAQGMPEADLPTGDAIEASFGMGWWKFDPAETEKLMASVGMKKGADGFFMNADGTPFTIDFAVPGDWNKTLQRLGFSIGDSWQKAGFNVQVRQVDNGEFNAVQNTNSKLELMLNWSNTCVYNSNWRNTWRVLRPENVKPADSSDPLTGNYLRVTDPDIFKIVSDSASLETDSDEFVKNGIEIAHMLTEGMQEINLMSIPTSIPTNNTYWTNYSKQDNFYAAPYTWWSSFKKTLVNIEPTGK